MERLPYLVKGVFFGDVQVGFKKPFLFVVWF